MLPIGDLIKREEDWILAKLLQERGQTCSAWSKGSNEDWHGLRDRFWLNITELSTSGSCPKVSTLTWEVVGVYQWRGKTEVLGWPERFPVLILTINFRSFSRICWGTSSHFVISLSDPNFGFCYHQCMDSSLVPLCSELHLYVFRSPSHILAWWSTLFCPYTCSISRHPHLMCVHMFVQAFSTTLTLSALPSQTNNEAYQVYLWNWIWARHH